MKNFICLFMIILSASFAFAGGNKEKNHQTVDSVDLQKFSGDWYVQALIPTGVEKKARNGIENYSFDQDGNIRVRYTFDKGNKSKIMYQKGWIYNDQTNAEWRVRPLWPLKLPYYILELDNDYAYTAIATTGFKYLWIMSREPSADKEEIERIINRMVERGFEKDKIIYMEQEGD